jgi:hypothetical protein
VGNARPQIPPLRNYMSGLKRYNTDDIRDYAGSVAQCGVMRKGHTHSPGHYELSTSMTLPRKVKNAIPYFEEVTHQHFQVFCSSPDTTCVRALFLLYLYIFGDPHLLRPQGRLTPQRLSHLSTSDLTKRFGRRLDPISAPVSGDVTGRRTAIRHPKRRGERCQRTIMLVRMFRLNAYSVHCTERSSCIDTSTTLLLGLLT